MCVLMAPDPTALRRRARVTRRRRDDTARLPARASHDLARSHRTDEEWLVDERWADPATRVLVVAVARLRVRSTAGDVGALPRPRRPTGLRILLGERDGVPHFALLVDPTRRRGPSTSSGSGLRAVVQTLAARPAEAPLMHARVALAEWHRPPGSARVRRAARSARPATCWPARRAQAAVPAHRPGGDHDGRHGSGSETSGACSAGRRLAEGRYSTLAGFVEPGETLEDAVAARSRRRPGSGRRRDYFGNQPWPFPRA